MVYSVNKDSFKFTHFPIYKDDFYLVIYVYKNDFAAILQRETNITIMRLPVLAVNFYHSMGKFNMTITFFIFSQKTGFDITCKLSLKETIYMSVRSEYYIWAAM